MASSPRTVVDPKIATAYSRDSWNQAIEEAEKSKAPRAARELKRLASYNNDAPSLRLPEASVLASTVPTHEDIPPSRKTVKSVRTATSNLDNMASSARPRKKPVNSNLKSSSGKDNAAVKKAAPVRPKSVKPGSEKKVASKKTSPAKRSHLKSDPDTVALGNEESCDCERYPFRRRLREMKEATRQSVEADDFWAICYDEQRT